MAHRLAEIRARLAAATPGPWRQTHDIKLGVKIWGRENTPPLFASIAGVAHSHITESDPVPQWQKDCDFVRNAPSDIAWLIERLAMRDAPTGGQNG